MVEFNQLISHRFRGFAKQENSLDGLVAALDFGVKLIEFDVRVTACGTPVIYHDEYAKDSKGKKRHISKTMAADFTGLGGTFAQIPTADALFKTIANHSNASAQLLVDIKDFGFETEINALLHLHRLQDRSVYVSWVPNVLYAMAKLAPNIPLCLSHWPQMPGPLIRAVHTVYEAPHGDVKRQPARFIHGERSGWYIIGGLRGELRALIKRSGGSVCVPKDMLIREEVSDYQKDGISVSAFSYVKPARINRDADQFKLDLYFVDNKEVFTAYKP